MESARTDGFPTVELHHHPGRDHLPAANSLRIWGIERAREFGPGTGIACGNVVAIDLDSSDSERIADLEALAFEVFGETPFVRVGRAPRNALVYRAAEPIRSQALKAADGSGDGIDVLACGRQVVAFGIHPKTLKQYSWRGASPLTDGPEIAPAITQAQVEAFVARAGAVVPLGKTAGRKGGAEAGGGGSAEIVRDASRKVTDGRESFLYGTVLSVARRLTAERGADLTIADHERLSNESWARFAAEAEIADGKWTVEHAREKAAWRIRHGLRDAPLHPVAAPGPAVIRLPLVDAERAVRDGIAAAFIEARDGAKRAWAFRIEAGIGKTDAAIGHLTRGMIFSVPTLKLADEAAARIRATGLTVEVARGFDAQDPHALAGTKMCLRPELLKKALDARLPIRPSLCERDGKRCPAFNECGKTRERRATPDVWVVTHAMLRLPRPKHIPAPIALVIDEGFALGTVPGRAEAITVDQIANISDEAAPALAPYRRALAEALRSHTPGALGRELAIAAGLTVDGLREAFELERGRLIGGVTPNMPGFARDEVLTRALKRNPLTRAMMGLWADLAELAMGAAKPSDRLLLTYDSKALAVERRPLSRVHEDWHAPTVILDATAPNSAMLKAALGLPVELKADIAAQWSEHVRVRQITGAPVSATSLGLKRPDGAAEPGIIVDLIAFIRWRCAEVPHGNVAVVGQKGLIEKLERRLPPNVVTGNFGAMAGLDKWKHVAGLVCIGRPLPPIHALEQTTSVLYGQVVTAVAPDKHGRTLYAKHPASIRAADGSPAEGACYCHPDPSVDAVRWQACEAELVQAIGRVRPLRRSAESPCFVDVICDMPLPIPVDTVEEWKDVNPAQAAVLLPLGVLLTNRADVMRALPGVSEDKARLIADRG